MNESPFPIELIGGSQDGRIMRVTEVPDHFGVTVVNDMKEIYQRQTEVEPFVYIQIGYAREGVWQC